MSTPIHRAVEAKGGQKALAVAIGASKSFVNQLVKGSRPIPPDLCPRIEAKTGIRCEELRPDIEWVRVKGKVDHYRVSVQAKAA